MSVAHSIGMVTKLEQFDNHFLKNFFVKQQKESGANKDGWVDLDKGNYEYTPEDYYMFSGKEAGEVPEKVHLQRMASIISPNYGRDNYLNQERDEQQKKVYK